MVFQQVPRTCSSGSSGIVNRTCRRHQHQHTGHCASTLAAPCRGPCAARTVTTHCQHHTAASAPLETHRRSSRNLSRSRSRSRCRCRSRSRSRSGSRSRSHSRSCSCCRSRSCCRGHSCSRCRSHSRSRSRSRSRSCCHTRSHSRSRTIAHHAATTCLNAPASTRLARMRPPARCRSCCLLRSLALAVVRFPSCPCKWSCSRVRVRITLC